MHKRLDGKYCLKITGEIYPLRILLLYLFKIVEEDLIIIYKTYIVMMMFITPNHRLALADPHS